MKVDPTLTAAAPDLLQACRNMLALLAELDCSYGILHNDMTDVEIEIERAIKKATGAV